ncbi:hypothetical protein AVEN_175926-1 [Araneus ventricosus]|uniref:Uncharacterized protein n=1 Tax=Araneus ventricosus TaxID=182803 RepID=A0A4Y1ZUI1_ARAVE|nr:hypothetical protein AVEN_175926-1 [Araneus ventricosus]
MMIRETVRRMKRQAVLHEPQDPHCGTTDDPSVGSVRSRQNTDDPEMAKLEENEFWVSGLYMKFADLHQFIWTPSISRKRVRLVNMLMIQKCNKLEMKFGKRSCA